MNKKEDWREFHWKFESWVRLISGGRTVSDPEMLQLLNSCLPTNLQKELQLWEREKGKLPTFVEFMANLEAKFGRAQGQNLRKKWQNVQIPKNYGKVSMQNFEEFKINFKLAQVEVRDTCPSEAREILMGKLTHYMKK